MKSSSDILNYLKNCDVVAIDEAQFFDSEIINVCNSIANNGIRVIVAGLDWTTLVTHLDQCQTLWQSLSMSLKFMQYVKSLEMLRTIVTEKIKKRIL